MTENKYNLKLNQDEKSEIINVQFDKLMYPKKHMCETYIKYKLKMNNKIEKYNDQLIFHVYQMKTKKKGISLNFKNVNVNFGVNILYRIYTIRRHSNNKKKKIKKEKRKKRRKK